jgi:hypothetical protein
VQGADSTAFSTGNYAMTLNFGTGASPTVPLPNTTRPNGNPISGGGGSAELSPSHNHHHGAKGHDPLPFGLPHGPMGSSDTDGDGHGHHHSGHPSV